MYVLRECHHGFEIDGQDPYPSPARTKAEKAPGAGLESFGLKKEEDWFKG